MFNRTLFSGRFSNATIYRCVQYIPLFNIITGQIQKQNNSSDEKIWIANGNVHEPNDRVISRKSARE